MLSCRCLTLAIALGIASSAVAKADFVYSFSGGSSGFGQTATYGFTFTPVVDITVDSLGFIDFAADGLAASHRVGIWNASGGLVASATVDNTNSTLAGAMMNATSQFRFTSIADVNLTAGATYTLGAAEETSSDRFFAGNAASLTNTSLAPSLVTISAGGVFSTSNFTKPTLTVGFGYGSGSFTAHATAAAVPEPSSLAMLGLGLGGAGLVARRGRRLAV